MIDCPLKDRSNEVQAKSVNTYSEKTLSKVYTLPIKDNYSQSWNFIQPSHMRNNLNFLKKWPSSRKAPGLCTGMN